MIVAEVACSSAWNQLDVGCFKARTAWCCCGMLRANRSLPPDAGSPGSNLFGATVLAVAPGPMTDCWSAGQFAQQVLGSQHYFFIMDICDERNPTFVHPRLLPVNDPSIHGSRWAAGLCRRSTETKKCIDPGLKPPAEGP
jgi:hypothetical protein